jgi:hypothetical protein
MAESTAPEHLRGELDTRRRFFVARGAISDLAADCVVVPNESFDVERSIFGVLVRPPHPFPPPRRRVSA